MNRGQSTIETMFAIGVILVFVSMLYGFLIYPRIDQTNNLQRVYAAKNTCSDLSTAINNVAYNGNGFSQKAALSATLSGARYNITIYNQIIEVSWENRAIFCQFRAKNITYAGKYPPFYLNITDHLLNNLDGVVKIA